MGVSGGDTGSSKRNSGSDGSYRHWESDVKTTTLGRSGLEVSRIAFGTWQLGGDWGRFDEEAAIAAIRAARDWGVNFFDTAQAYGFGASERLLGQALRSELNGERDQLVIATKGG